MSHCPPADLRSLLSLLTLVALTALSLGVSLAPCILVRFTELVGCGDFYFLKVIVTFSIFSASFFLFSSWYPHYTHVSATSHALIIGQLGWGLCWKGSSAKLIFHWEDSDTILFSLGYFLTVFRNLFKWKFWEFSSQAHENLPERSCSKLGHQHHMPHAGLFVSLHLEVRGFVAVYKRQLLVNDARATAQLAFKN